MNDGILSHVGETQSNECGEHPGATQAGLISSPGVCSRLFCAALIVLVAASCAPSLTEVKYIVDNKPLYVREQFATQKIPPETLGFFINGKKDFKKYTNFTVNYDCQIEADGNQARRKLTWSNSYLGPGLSRVDIEAYNNDIPYSSELAIEYLGVVDIRSQYLRYANMLAEQILELKSISAFPAGLADAKANSHYELKTEYGLADALTGARNESYSFNTKQVVPASQISAKLSGNAIMMEIEEKNLNGMVSGKSTVYYISDYGLAVQVERQSSTFKRSCSVNSIEIN